MELLTYADTRTQFFNDQIKKGEETMERIKGFDVSEFTKHNALFAEEMAIGFYREALKALNWNKIEPDDEGLYTGNLPDEGEEVLFCKKNGEIFIGEICCGGLYDGGNGIMMAYVGNGFHLDDIAAWMPLPIPYKE